MKRFGWSVPASTFSHLQANQQRWLITALIVLGSLSIAHQGILQPLRRQRAVLDARLTTAQQRITLLQALDTASRQLQQSRRRLRARAEAPSLLQDLAGVAAAHEVLVNAAAPQPMKPAGRYAQLPVRLTITGTFPNLLQFLYAVETAPQPVLVEQVELAPQGTLAEAGTIARTLEAQVTVVALFLES